jgi:SAM-dependent methyltransferase
LARRAANKQYWSACTDTHLASSDYYRRARTELNDRLANLLRPTARLIELGCGDGEAALDAAPRCASVTGYDVSAALVERANTRARDAGLTHVHFQTADLEDGPLPPVDADVLLCLGVFSCLPDDVVTRVLNHLGRGLRPGALLVLRETVSLGPRREVVYATGYCGRYRPIGAYLDAVASAGFSVFDDVPLTDPQGGLENHLWFWRRTA